MRRFLALCGLLLLVSACGIPIDAEPELIVLDSESPTEIDEPVVEDLASASIYLVRDDALVHATRDLPTPATPEVVVSSLLDGLTDPEERANLRTSIPPGTELLGLGQDAGVLRVNLTRDFVAVGGEEEIHAVAQIVLTVTAIEGVELVAFEIDGVPTDVPVANGALSVEPVGARHYEVLLDA